MNEEKLYAVKNDKGEYWDFYDIGGFWQLSRVSCSISEDTAKNAVKENGGHVVTLIEEPKKVVVSPEEAKNIDALINAKSYQQVIAFATFIFNHKNSKFVKRILKAITNGYTVAKEKKYNVKVPLVQAQGGLWFYINSEDKLDATYLQDLAKKFTMDEIEENGLQDCEKEEANDDEV